MLMVKSRLESVLGIFKALNVTNLGAQNPANFMKLTIGTPNYCTKNESKLMDAAIIWEISSVVNFDTIGLLSPRSSTEQLPMQQMNVCIPHVHVNVDNHSTDPLGPLSPSRANVKVVMTVLAIIGGIRLVGRMLYKRWGAFTEADINMGLMREPAVVRRGDPTFEIRPSIE